jgi:DNA-binding HxlR family transcriptional regulator
MGSDRVYRHFCMMARALELIGERWSLLIVRDLLFGPRRFTDLARSLAEITPTRLTGRLRQLEAAGIVAREPPREGREVWYRLTRAGSDLGPVVDALTLWGIDHARQPPLPDESAHPQPVMIGTKVWLTRHGVAPTKPVAWTWRFPGGDHYTLRLDEAVWALAREEAPAAAVTVTATPEAWARFLTAPQGRRHLPRRDIQLEASPKALEQFANSFRATLNRPGRRSARPR